MKRLSAADAFKNAPAQAIDSFKQTMGIVYSFNGKEISPLICILILVATGMYFIYWQLLRCPLKKSSNIFLYPVIGLLDCYLIFNFNCLTISSTIFDTISGETSS